MYVYVCIYIYIECQDHGASRPQILNMPFTKAPGSGSTFPDSKFESRLNVCACVSVYASGRVLVPACKICVRSMPCRHLWMQACMIHVNVRNAWVVGWRQTFQFCVALLV